MILILFANEYPYVASSEAHFVRPEIRPLAAHFERLILVPESIAGTRDQIDQQVQIQESYAHGYAELKSKTAHLKNALTLGAFWREIKRQPRLILQQDAFKRLVVFASKSKFTMEWTNGLIERNHLDPSELVLYTYWFYASAFGLGLLKARIPQLVLISRAHGFDFYENYHSHSYIPFRSQAVNVVDLVLPDSEAGTKYLLKRYSILTGRCETGRMGVRDPGFVTATSEDGISRIVSCSYINSRKRVDLLLRGIECAARARPGHRFEWHHFGTGDLRDPLVEEAERRLPTNVTWTIPGYSSSEDLMQFYRENPVDLFVNVSRSEGTPVSIMEAISCGIPVMATAVGGNVEIVSEKNGWLLSANPTEQEIANALLTLNDDPVRLARMRAASRQVWAEKYNAERNLDEFAKKLVQLRLSKNRL